MDPQVPRNSDLPAVTQVSLPLNNSPSDSRALGTHARPRLSVSLQASMQEFKQQGDVIGVSRPSQFGPRPRSTSRPPPLRTHRPRGNTISPLSERNNPFSSNQNQIHGRGNGPNFQQFGARQPSGGQQNSNSQQRQNSQQAGGPNQNTPYGFQNSSGVHFPMMQEHAGMQNRLFSIAQMVSNQSAIPQPLVSRMTADLGNFSGHNEELQNVFRNEKRLLLLECEKLSDLLSVQKQLTQNAMAERDRACGERDRLEAKLNVVQRRQKEFDVKMDQMEKKNGATIEFLRKQLRIKDEQLKGKRSLWIDSQSHRISGLRKNSDIRDPLATPTARDHPHSRMDKVFVERSGEMPSTPGPSKSGLLESLQLDNAGGEPKNEFWPYWDEGNINLGARAEIADSSIADSKALVPYKTEDAIAQEFCDDFTILYDLVGEWVQRYAHIVNDNPSADHRLSYDPNVWPFMLGCTYEDFALAHDHTILLLRNPATRPSFGIRVIIQYFYTYVWKATAFGAFNAESCEQLENIDGQLKIRGLEPAQRAQLVTEQTQVIQSIVESDKYPAFRSHILATHSKGLRVKVGPLLDETSSRTEAGKALLSIVVRAWDISAMMYSSNHTFLINFPACGSKFLATTMECQNPDNQETDHSIHLRQAKVKLAMKPVITMRNDQNYTISVKKIYDSHVLIFP